ncbi:transposase [Canicola haemoglobinophilus]|uniref:Transposase n=2 Tax=Canicola haemoglobinophilus TaxID=733 RepID=A0A377HTJ5_9PAST|nr:DNA-binding protein [Canicola haemoglobinophilus]STO55052.1 transposase [Canicola haemoglobinophilus]STO59765.1 transposase [Canicola haemoglobinophilus]STO69377.1 transposase [Canicola haemoglobinophilus]
MEQVSLKTHYSVYELADLGLLGLPKAPKNISVQAKRENWQSRKREGRGGGLEYAFSSLPIEVQQEILLKTTPQQTAAELQKIEQNRPLASNELWQMWDDASHKAQEQAKIKLGVMFAVANLVESGVNVLNAFDAVCGKENAERQQNNQKKLTVGSLKNWWYLIKNAPRED